MHDLVRELCLKKAKEERFNLTIEYPMLSPRFYDVIRPSYKPTVRVFIETKYISVFPRPSTQNLRSIFFGYFGLYNDYMARYFRSFVLLRVLDLQACELGEFPKGMELLVHLRYLRIWMS
ncbi:hypothetical protein Hanom_Chr16g01448861 [Helianthus anomalus]